MPASSYQQQKLRVCEVCSAYLGIHDNDRRLADHFGGKLHLGFIKIREKLAELEVCDNFFFFYFKPIETGANFSLAFFRVWISQNEAQLCVCSCYLPLKL